MSTNNKKTINVEDILSSESIPDEIEEQKSKNYFFDFLNDLYYNKKYIFNDDTKKDYKPYVINRYISGNLDTVLYAQEMNERSYLDPEIQYNYYFHSIRKQKRFSKWIKPSIDKKIEILKKYYDYSYIKAKQVLKLHDKKDFKYIQKKLDTGGPTN